jgi:hypothetical protein
MHYVVKVADNFHYMEDEETYIFGTFKTQAEAEEACKRIVERSIPNEPGASAESLLEHYRNFGEDPFIVAIADEGEPLPTPERFSAWDYARQLCEQRPVPTKKD